jgi:hypothetical protein
MALSLHRTPLLLPALLGLGCQALLEGQYPLGDVNLRPGNGFSVRADLFCELSCGLSYRCWDTANSPSPWTRLGYTTVDPGEIEWSLRTSPDDRWAGLADRLDPQVILALHDFETGFDWPSCVGLEPQACLDRAGEGLTALQEPGGKPHILATHALGDGPGRVLP